MDTAESHGEDRDAAAKWRATGLGRSICPRHLRHASLHPKQKSDSGTSSLCGLSQAPHMCLLICNIGKVIRHLGEALSPKAVPRTQ